MKPYQNVLVCAPQSQLGGVGGSMGEFLRAVVDILTDEGLEFEVISQSSLDEFKRDGIVGKLLAIAHVPWILLYWILAARSMYRFKHRCVIVISQEYVLPFCFSRQIVYFHDGIQYFFPRNRLTACYYQRYLMMVARRCRVLLCCSNFTGRSLARIYGVQRWFLSLVPSRLSLTSKVKCSDSRQPTLRDIDFLWVGTLAAHKRFSDFVQLAVDSSCNATAKFCVAVLPSRDAEEARALLRRRGAEDKITIVSGLSPYELADIYSRSKFFVSTSRIEGYGMPVLEAALNGCGLCLSRIGVYVELFSGLVPVWIDKSNMCNLDSCQRTMHDRQRHALMIDHQNSLQFRRMLLSVLG